MAKMWFVKLGEKTAGPFSPAQIKQMASSGQLTPASLICRETDNTPDGQWVEASRIKGLFQSLAPRTSKTARSEDLASPATPEVNINTAGRISVSMTGKHEARKSTSQDVVYVIFGLFCCFPIGLYLLWTRNWKTNTKVIITAAMRPTDRDWHAIRYGFPRGGRLNSPVRSAPTSADVREESMGLGQGSR